MEYPEAIHYIQNLTRFGINFGLGRITELLHRLGNPHMSLRVIHIGGTNGKGSTAAMTTSILKAAGYKTGAFTSPHLHSYTERYCINGEEISFKRIAELITCLRFHLDSMVSEGFEHPTEFEVSTALAFQYYLEEKVDFLILEVGLGGAIDSTNVVKPLIAIITNVSMDHMNYLGHTVEEIASVKAGIIKDGIPVITAADDLKAMDVIYKVCQKKGAPLIKIECLEADDQPSFLYRRVFWKSEDRDFSLEGQKFAVKGLSGNYYENLFLNLLGRHQLVNAATAIATAEALMEQGYSIPVNALYRGLADVRWPARLEIFKREPLIVLDGAHNYNGAKVLRKALEDYFPGKGIVLVLGMLGDKQRVEVVSELVPAVRCVVITRPNSSRAGDWKYLAEVARNYTEHVYVKESIKDAVLQGINLAGAGEIVCITGSLYMVAEAREVLRCL